MKNRSASLSLLVGVFVMVLAASNSIVRAVVCNAGASTTWTNATGGSWFDCTNNWSNGCPVSGKCVFIDDGGDATIDSSGGTAHAFSLTLGDSQGASGSVSVSGGDLEIDPYYPYPDCPGTIYVSNQGIGDLTIEGVGGTVHCRFLYIAATANQNGARSGGTVTVKDGAQLLLDPGECNLGAQICIGCDANGNAGGTAALNIQDGTVAVNNTDPYGQVVPAGVKVGSSGTLKGNSTLAVSGASSLARTAIVLGTLAPSGQFTVEGNLDLTGNGINSANTICHVTPTANDRIDVTAATGGGQVTIGGRITVIMSGSLTQGSTFTLLHADGGRNNSSFAFTSIINNGTGCFTPTIVYVDNIDGSSDVNLYLAPRNRCN